ncbi:MAG TPA: NAD-dependent epimerase/dehydratase family protein [Terrimicrobiaceae bacterium]
MKTILVTGSSGLVGSEACAHFALQGGKVHGIDNNQRAVIFGPQGDTRFNQERLLREIEGFEHHELDIRNREGVRRLIAELRPSAIVHCAAQPSHDRSADIPLQDFDINATGTINLLEAARESSPESPFVYISTNKVYGDRPNTLQMEESALRWDFADPRFLNGIPEDFPIDQSTHALFGASKLAADILVQEYGRRFGLPTCCLRCGCLTGPNHAAVELHGFLGYLIKCNVEGRQYKVYGHKGKQVRDNVHAKDVVRFIAEFVANPRVAEVYNLGGGKANSCSILEAFALAERFSGRPQNYVIVEAGRIGDHMCYYSDLRKIKSHYPTWEVSVSLPDIVAEIVEAWSHRLSRKPSIEREDEA